MDQIPYFAVNMRCVGSTNTELLQTIDHAVHLPSGVKPPSVTLISRDGIPYHIELMHRVPDTTEVEMTSLPWVLSYQRFCQAGTVFNGVISHRRLASAQQSRLGALLMLDDEAAPQRVTICGFIAQRIGLPRDQKPASFEVAAKLKAEQLSYPVGHSRLTIGFSDVRVKLNEKHSHHPIYDVNAVINELSWPALLVARATGFVSGTGGWLHVNVPTTIINLPSSLSWVLHIPQNNP